MSYSHQQDAMHKERGDEARCGCAIDSHQCLKTCNIKINCFEVWIFKIIILIIKVNGNC